MFQQSLHPPPLVISRAISPPRLAFFSAQRWLAIPSLAPSLPGPTSRATSGLPCPAPLCRREAAVAAPHPPAAAGADAGVCVALGGRAVTGARADVGVRAAPGGRAVAGARAGEQSFAPPLREGAEGSRGGRRRRGRRRRGAEQGAAVGGRGGGEKWRALPPGEGAEGSRGHRRRREGAEGSRGARALVKRIRKEKEEFDIWDARVSGCGVGELKEPLGFRE